MSVLQKILDKANETMSSLGALPSAVIGTVNSRNSRGGSNKIRINDRRKVKYRKFTKADLIKASKKYVTSDEYLN